MKITVAIHRPELLEGGQFKAEFFDYNSAKEFFARMEKLSTETVVADPTPEIPTTKRGFVWWFGERTTEKGETVRLITENDNRVDVRIVKASRNKEGKMEYETFETLQVADGTAEEVSKVVSAALTNASRTK